MKIFEPTEIVVKEAFAIEGRGVVLLPGLKDYAGATQIRVELLRPDGCVAVKSARMELEHLYRRASVSSFEWFIVLQGALKEDAPVGTRVTLLDTV